jgi:hypothetical protein
MISKRLLVLANSTKHHPMRCVAGRELLGEVGGTTQWGDWIRPISTHDEGALSFSERRLTDGTDPKPLDVIRVPMSAQEHNPLQPENWLIQSGQVWTKESSCNAEVLIPLVEEPSDLWLQPGQRHDRVHTSFLKNLPKIQSLYLIRPESFAFRIQSKTWNNETKRKVRAVFTYKGRFYDLALEDPSIGAKCFPNFSKVTDGTIPLKAPVLLCVSLPQEFREFKEPGYHFKVVATVFELPA